jgi:hypothetical protein
VRSTLLACYVAAAQLALRRAWAHGRQQEGWVWRGGGEVGAVAGSRLGSNGSYNYFATYGAIAPWLVAPSSYPPLSSAHLAGRRRAHRQQQQALTQAPSTKQSKSTPVTAQRQAAWLGLAAPFWLLASTSPAAAAKISKPAAQKTQQQQALTQAPSTSTKQSKSKPVAAQSGRFWLLPRRPPKFLSLRRRRAHSNSRH